MKRFNIAISVIIGAAFLYFAFRGVNFKDVIQAFKHANYLYIIPSLFFLLLYILVRTYRWGLIFKPGEIPLFKVRLSAILIGIMVNNILPAKLGEVARAFIMGKKAGVGVSRTFGTIILERVFDFLALLFFLVVIALLSTVERDMVFKSSGGSVAVFVTTAAGFLGILGVLFLLKFKTELAANIAGKISGTISKKYAGKAVEFVKNFADGLRPLDDPSNAIKIFLVSLAQWCLSGALAYFMMLAFSININAVSAFFVFIIITLGVVIPPSPAGVGTTQFFAVKALAFYGVSQGEALSFSLVYNFTVTAVLTLAGWYYLIKESLKLSELLSSAEKGSKAGISQLD